MSELLSRPVVPVASPDDATATARAIEAHLDEVGTLTLLHVVEKGGGAPDKVSVEQREEYAEEAFAAFRTALPDAEVATEITYATDVAAGIVDAAGSLDASAIVFTSRGGGWLLNVLSGDVRGDLFDESDLPIVALPSPEGGTGS